MPIEGNVKKVSENLGCLQVETRIFPTYGNNNSISMVGCRACGPNDDMMRNSKSYNR